MAFDTLSREMLAQNTDGQEHIQAIKFSPDGALLALASRDNTIYIYQASDTNRRFAKIGKCSVGVQSSV